MYLILKTKKREIGEFTVSLWLLLVATVAAGDQHYMASDYNTGKCNWNKAALINIFVLTMDQMYHVKKYTQICISAQLFGVFWHLLAFCHFVF